MARGEREIQVRQEQAEQSVGEGDALAEQRVADVGHHALASAEQDHEEADDHAGNDSGSVSSDSSTRLPRRRGARGRCPRLRPAPAWPASR
ncbi:hypothetical protein DdX_21419 [Ditylenchus destructor]|uniref:Uncharacterized protein n=1 Tax=Ditylenchus destructor TaxID=166010 RepID=A0AAD4QT29_9BILA|nr:hypothetical protein DdX_21419 [Ditylenchus destructor]